MQEQGIVGHKQARITFKNIYIKREAYKLSN